MIHSHAHVKLIALLFALLAFSARIDAANETQHVLFVGNSYTYLENLPHVVAALSERSDRPVKVTLSTAGGATWEDHWKERKGLQTVSLMDSGQYDYVVLQEQSTRPIWEPDLSIEFGQRLCRKVSKSGAVPLLFLTWARRDKPEMQERLTQIYEQIAVETGAKIVPVGLAWARTQKLHPEIRLYANDGSHPTELGTYLSACMFYRCLTGSSPIGLPRIVKMEDRYGQSVILMIVERKAAEFLQSVAEETWVDYTSEK